MKNTQTRIDNMIMTFRLSEELAWNRGIDWLSVLRSKGYVRKSNNGTQLVGTLTEKGKKHLAKLNADHGQGDCERA
jgi:predicted transcriptional regulator